MVIKVNNKLKINLTPEMIKETIDAGIYKGIPIGKPTVRTELHNRMAVIEMIHSGDDMGCYQGIFRTKEEFDNNIKYLEHLIDIGVLNRNKKEDTAKIPTIFDNWLMNVESVTQYENYYVFKMKNNTEEIKMCFNGEIYKYSGGTMKYSNRKGSDRSMTSIFAGRRHTDVTGERLILVAKLLLDDCIPLITRGMQANCMDFSGSKETSKKYDLVHHNFKPNHIEISDNSANTRHKWMWERLYQMTGRKYVISGYDNALHFLLRSGTVADINWYIDLKGIQEVK